MSERELQKGVFSGSNGAFEKLYTQCREPFMKYFRRRFPATETSLPDLFQESVVALWRQIADGKLTEDGLHCSLQTYLISIGSNKMHEGFRNMQRGGRLLDALREHPDSYRVAGGTRTALYKRGVDEEDEEKSRAWTEFLRTKYEELGYPCAQLLRDTWYNEMSDNDILLAFNGYFANTDVVKSKRYKCHKSLLNMFNAWKKATQK